MCFICESANPTIIYFMGLKLEASATLQTRPATLRVLRLQTSLSSTKPRFGQQVVGEDRQQRWSFKKSTSNDLTRLVLSDDDDNDDE